MPRPTPIPSLCLVAVVVAGCQATHRPPASPPGVRAEAAPPAAVDQALEKVCRQARDNATRRSYPHEDMDAVLWLQTAAEYQANATTVYRAAAAALPGLVAAAKERRADPVVVLDLDETVFDNSAFQGRLLAEARNYDSDLWDCWVGQKRADVVPGADLLFRAVTAQGVRARFITNRKCRPRGDGAPCPQEGETLENLNALLRETGYVATADELLLSAEKDPKTGAAWDDEKQPRRDFVSATHEIVMLVGDDLGDFLPGVRKTTMAARAEAMAGVSERWGTSWFALPNPSYGSWLTAIDQEAAAAKPRKRHEVIEAFPYPRE